MSLSDIDSIVRDQLLGQIVAQVQGAGTEASSLGPPCSAFYLVHYAMGEPRAEPDESTRLSPPEDREPSSVLTALLKAAPGGLRNFPRGRAIGLWRVTLSGVEELPVEMSDSVTTGETRGALFENARVSLWIDPGRGLAYVDWVYGPLYARGETYTIRRHGDTVSLEDGEMRWMS